MAKVYLVKNGPHGDRTSDGHDKAISQLTTDLNTHVCQFLGTEPPQFNIEQPDDYYSHVVIQVLDEDQTNDKFPHIGFYVVSDLDASQSTFLLN